MGNKLYKLNKCLKKEKENKCKKDKCKMSNIYSQSLCQKEFKPKLSMFHKEKKPLKSTISVYHKNDTNYKSKNKNSNKKKKYIKKI